MIKKDLKIWWDSTFEVHSLVALKNLWGSWRNLYCITIKATMSYDWDRRKDYSWIGHIWWKVWWFLNPLVASWMFFLNTIFEGIWLGSCFWVTLWGNLLAPSNNLCPITGWYWQPYSKTADQWRCLWHSQTNFLEGYKPCEKFACRLQYLWRT
jgi:hypothetical protein